MPRILVKKNFRKKKFKHQCLFYASSGSRTARVIKIFRMTERKKYKNLFVNNWFGRTAYLVAGDGRTRLYLDHNQSHRQPRDQAAQGHRPAAAHPPRPQENGIAEPAGSTPVGRRRLPPGSLTLLSPRRPHRSLHHPPTPPLFASRSFLCSLRPVPGGSAGVLLLAHLCSCRRLPSVAFQLARRCFFQALSLCSVVSVQRLVLAACLALPLLFLSSAGPLRRGSS